MNNPPKRFRLGLVDWILLVAVGLLVAVLFLPRPDAAPSAASSAPAPEPEQIAAAQEYLAANWDIAIE